MAELDLVKNINARQIKLLQENGISSAEALAMSPHNIISEIDGFGDKTAKKLIWNARNALGMSEFTTAEDIDENTEYITTGSAELNRILGGGFQTGKLTEVYGPFKSGKTNLAHTIAVSTQLPKDKGGLGAKVAYIDTENTFSKEKIKRIAKRFGMDPKKVLSGIFHARIFSSDHQSQMITKAETLCKTRGVRLIVMDSLMALMRAEYVGIGMLARRQSVLNNMIHALSRIAETYNCAVLLTNQVATKMMGMFSGDDAIGGNIIAHGCHFRVMFKTKGFSSNNSLKRRAVIVDAPDLPPEEAEFYITSVGIADTENAEIPKGDTSGFEVPSLYEEIDEDEMVAPNEPETNPENDSDEENLTSVKGIGAGMAVQLKKAGINSVDELISAQPEELASKVSGASLKKVQEWQGNAKGIIQA
ncbi:MAG: DNA repair and recombination protein RadA [Candidatus Lokiarchaeota archaeon]|nr:DNA repair and recombination protein RadA [Candidatus Lokiarchaeota archaeon]